MRDILNTEVFLIRKLMVYPIFVCNYTLIYVNDVKETSIPINLKLYIK